MALPIVLLLYLRATQIATTAKIVATSPKTMFRMSLVPTKEFSDLTPKSHASTTYPSFRK